MSIISRDDYELNIAIADLHDMLYQRLHVKHDLDSGFFNESATSELESVYSHLQTLPYGAEYDNHLTACISKRKSYDEYLNLYGIEE